MKDTQGPLQEDASHPAPHKPPMPEVLSYLTVGFNSTTRHLENEAQRTVQRPTLTVSGKLAAVFVPQSDHAPILTSHLPLLVYTASLVRRSSPAIRLVNLPKRAEARLCAALHLPHVSFVGLFEGAPNATPLIDFVTERVDPVEVPWFKEAGMGTYMPVETKSLETTAPAEARNAKRIQESLDAEKEKVANSGEETEAVIAANSSPACQAAGLFPHADLSAEG